MSDDLLEQLEERVRGMSPDEMRQLQEMAAAQTSGMVWVPSPGPQSEAFFSDADELFYGGQAGGGKGLLPDEKIATPYGMRLMRHLKVGDKVLAADGSATKVIGVYPQPEQPVYRVTFTDGASIVTDGPHKWLYCKARRQWRESNWKIATTEQIRSQMKDGGRILTPLCQPLRFTKSYRYNMRPIDPYALGLLIGDGYTAQNGAGAKWSFSTSDPELVQYLPGEWVYEGRCDYRLRGPMRESLHNNFSRLGLEGCRAPDKFIPESYKFASTEQRWALLQGLMDTDGTVSKDGKAYFCSISKTLADDVRWLVLSLGGRATVTEKKTKSDFGIAYNVYVRMRDNSDVFGIERKRSLARKYKGGMQPKRRIKSIEKCGHSETICIAVDHKDSLYVAGDDLIVTHNTDLLCGLALTSHQESLILRRYRGDAEDISDRIEEIMDSGKGRNRAKERWNVTVGDVKRDILLDGVKEEKDKQRHKGRARDFYGFDEISDFTRSQFEFIKTWNRSADPGQRCRVVCTGNPPTTPEGQWVVNYWAAWLDPKHPDPARPGELRWYTTDKFGQEWEVDGPGPHVIEHPDGDVEELFARSRTFIRSTLDDNPYLRDSDYKATLDALPSELRSAYRDGRFDMAMEDDPWQIIPTDWIMDAQRRWSENPPDKVPMCSMGVDVAQGGEANTVIAPRYDGWFAPLIVRSGTETKDGKSVAGLIIQERADEAIPVIDMGGGYGASAYEVLQDNGVESFPWKGAESTSQKTREGTLGFANKRSQAYWQFREALDPSQQGGSRIQLPDDSELISDLTAVTFQMKRGQGGQMVIQAEPKLDVIERLGRSPDKGDAVVMSWQAGQKLETNGRMWRKTASPPSVVMGHQQRRKNARK